MSSPYFLKVSQSWGSAAALLIVGSAAGFLIGRVTAATETIPSHPNAPTNSPEAEAESSSDDESDEESFQQFPGSHEECKLVLAVRSDLGMTKGRYRYVP
jgi:PTH2 family peptidyl-tRNA hydrolase